MICHQIQAENFRNIAGATVDFSPGINLLLGNNAQGKTNLLEAITLMAIGKSFRGAKDADLIRFGEQTARVSLSYHDGIRLQNLTSTLCAGKRRRTEQNGVPLARMSETVGAFRVVLFCPEHLSLIKSGPELRRGFLDIAISQLKPLYLAGLQKYAKILKQRNALLKSAAENPALRRQAEETLDVWSDQLAREAAVISLYRARYVRRMREAVAQVFGEMTGGREVPVLTYEGSSHGEEESYLDRKATEETYRRLLHEFHDREFGAGCTLYGPHRDDMAVTLNGVSARLYASQGQQRSLSLAMKLAEGEISRESCGDYPVFLFDDVLSELDQTRRDYLTRHIREKQVIMTGCEVPEKRMPAETHVIRVNGGMFVPEESPEESGARESGYESPDPELA